MRTTPVRTRATAVAAALALGQVLAWATPTAAHAQTIAEIDESISRIEQTIGEKEQAVSDAQGSLSDVIRDAYKSGELGASPEVALLIQSDTLDDLIEGAQYATTISDRYVAMIDAAKATLDELEEARDSLTELRAVREAQIRARERADSMHFCQWGESYSDIRYYCGTIGSAGCGLCAYTVAINILKGTDYTPETMLATCGDWAGLVHNLESRKGTPDGSTHAEWTKSYFDVDMTRIGNSVSELRDALSDGESVVIALARGASYKNKSGSWRYTRGHYVCIYRCDDEGFYVQDSAQKANEGAAVYYRDSEMGTMLRTGTFTRLSN